ncbi:hypothetical protein ACNARK_03830 [Proteus sp. DFP240708]|uniref:hypothetical protein n=1 Tax=Proteus TaxID=583 RepID=UPI0028897D07|nr:hypothetical protein [Proteus columbae]
MRKVIIIKSDSTTETMMVDKEITALAIPDITLVPKDIRVRPIEEFLYKDKLYFFVRDCELVSDDRVLCVISGID